MALLDYLSQNKIVEIQLVLVLHFAYIFDSLKKCHSQLVIKGHQEALSYILCSKMEQNHTSWQSFNKINSIFKWYKLISSGYMIYLICRNILPINLVLKQIGFEGNMHCYLSGRFIITKDTSRPMSVSFAVSHLVWRFWQNFKRPRSNDLVLFLISDDREVKRVARYHNLSKDIELFHLNCHDKVLRSAMCYIVNDNSARIYRLRANRTPDALITLRQYVTKINIISIFLFFMLGSPIFVHTIRYILFDVDYLEAYKGCSPELERLNQEGKLHKFSVNFNVGFHRIFAFIIDFCENFFLWADSGVAFTVITSMVYYLTYDLKLYWDRVQTLLDHLNYEVVMNQLLHPLDEGKLLSPRLPTNKDHIDLPTTNQISILTCSYFDRTPSFNYEQNSLDELILQTQGEMIDFLSQLRQSDYIVSDILTMGAILWITQFALINCFAGEISQDTAIIYVLQTFGCIFLSIISFNIFIFQRDIAKSYGVICSIVANCKSVYRFKLVKLLEIYNMKNHTTYTLAHSKPYVKTTFLTIIGWTFSCLIIIKSLVENELAKGYIKAARLL